jgi:hypothetical protein
MLQSACGADAALDAEVDELGERVAVLEATGGADGGADGSGDGIADASVEQRLVALEQEAADLRSQLEAQAELDRRVAAVESSLAGVEDEVSGLADELASAGASGGVWFEEGSGLGTCARVNVVTTSARPLIVMATVEVDASGELAWCTEGSSSYSCSSFPATYPPNWEVSGDFVVHTENVGGASFTAESSRTFVRSRETVGYANLGSYNFTRFEEFQSSSVESISTVVSIPAPGSYTVEARVNSTGAVGTCRLVVLQQ